MIRALGAVMVAVGALWAGWRASAELRDSVRAVEAVIDGGYGLCVPTTVVDCTDESDIVVLREGIGELV